MAVETLQQTLESNTPDEPKVIYMASVAVKKVAAALNHSAGSDFGPYGVGRLPNDFDGYPNPDTVRVWHSTYSEDQLPAYILASRVSVQEIAC